MKNDLIKNLFFILVIFIIAVIVFDSFGPREPQQQSLTYSQFLTRVEDGQITSVTITDEHINGTNQAGTEHFTAALPPIINMSLLETLQKYKVTITGKPKEPQSMWTVFLLYGILPTLLLIGFLMFMMRQQMGGGKGGPFSFGRSRARLLTEGNVKVTFADVAGCDEEKEEVSEIVDFLRDPSKFQKVGGKIPKGVLLVGPPGTGKTLLAKAVAGEAKVPFFSISGSDFVEMFVGVGASRVRNMFEQAKKQAPCIIFIDEIDAVGRQRGAGLGGGHDEREQTLNQLLVEMDGFEDHQSVIVIAATNRPDVLDPALLRPGRFDRQVVVPLPDIKGREHILKVHLKKVTTEDDVNPLAIARGTPGFSGADLANLVNEAALFAARDNKLKVGMNDLERAKDKIMMGAERKRVMKDSEKKLTAYHEAGHAIVGWHLPEHDPIYKVTIIPRGRALGVTMFLPEDDRYSMSRQHLLSQISTMFGGRIAEELIFGKDAVTTGASNDIERATKIARNMVTQWGLSDALGPLRYGEDEGEVFLGQSMVTRHKEMSEETAQAIDKEVRRIIDESYARAQKLLEDNLSILHLMADALIKYETIERNQIEELMAGKPASPPPDWDEDLEKVNRQKTATVAVQAEDSAVVPEQKQAPTNDNTPEKERPAEASSEEANASKKSKDS
ncbi:MAG: ATP-dependent zinc metalloprotease FtsH [Pseudomonadota bacterium]